MRKAIGIACLCLAGACAAGCAEDTVYPGFYGEPETTAQPITGGPSGAAGATGPTLAGSAAPSDTAAGAVAGSSAIAPPLAGAGDGGSSIDASRSGSSGATVASGGPTPGAAAGGQCDLSGRWLVTMHYVTDAIGQLQTVHSYLYYEIAARGDGFAITKGLHCGEEVLAEGLFAVKGDSSGARAAITRKLSYAGRPVSSQASASGCEVEFGKWYIVVGATYPYYADPSIALPTIDQPASGSAPGWEDWDGDGQPGVTIVLSGTVAGKVFVASRVWSQARGTVPQAGQRFQLPLQWDQEKNVIGYDGSPLLASDAVRAADPSLHFVELAKLDASRATGDDLAICRAVIELAPTLTPTASAL